MKLVYLIIGGISLLLGMTGIVLPGLPTVPFLLLAAGCLAKSSDRLHRKLVGTKLYQKYAAEFVERGGMSRSIKIRILIMSTTMMLIAMLLAPVFWMKMIIITVIIIKYYVFLVRIPTLKE